MQQIPLASVPSQSLSVVLAGQNCTINVYQKEPGLLFDLVGVVVAVLANDAGFLVCRQYEGFKGNLCFVDTQGNNDPEYAGLGTRYVLVYLTEAEYALIR